MSIQLIHKYILERPSVTHLYSKVGLLLFSQKSKIQDISVLWITSFPVQPITSTDLSYFAI